VTETTSTIQIELQVIPSEPVILKLAGNTISQSSTPAQACRNKVYGKIANEAPAQTVKLGVKQTLSYSYLLPIKEIVITKTLLQRVLKLLNNFNSSSKPEKQPKTSPEQSRLPIEDRSFLLVTS
jgi:hypothetical protein